MSEVDEHVTVDIDCSSPDRFKWLDTMLVNLATKLACGENAPFTGTEVAAAYLNGCVNVLMNGLSQADSFQLLRALVADLEARTADATGRAN